MILGPSSVTPLYLLSLETLGSIGHPSIFYKKLTRWIRGCIFITQIGDDAIFCLNFIFYLFSFFWGEECSITPQANRVQVISQI